MEGSFAIMLLYLVVLTVMNAGVIAFAATTVLFKHMGWFMRVVVAFIAMLSAGGTIYLAMAWAAGLHHGFDDHWGKPIGVSFVCFHFVAFVAVIWSIIWALRRRTRGFLSVVKWGMLPCAVVGGFFTGLTVISAGSMLFQHPIEMEPRGIVVPESPDYQENLIGNVNAPFRHDL